MSKMKLVEMVTNTNSEVIEDLSYVAQPNFQITDVTIIPDEEYRPTVQGILINLEESQKLHETQSTSLSINILSETVNEKTGYSNSLFEFESNKGTITLSLALTESTKHAGVFNVSAFTTKGEKVFETNTQHPQRVIQGYLNDLSSKYLLEATLLPNKESKEDLEQTKHETLDSCIREALAYSSDIGEEPRTKDIYIDEVKEGDFKIVDKESKKTVAIITPQGNVYQTKFEEIPEQTDVEELKSDDKDNAKAPKETKEIDVKPKELEDLKESDRLQNIEISNGELTGQSAIDMKDFAQESVNVNEIVGSLSEFKKILNDGGYTTRNEQELRDLYEYYLELCKELKGEFNESNTDSETRWNVEIKVNGEPSYVGKLVVQDVQRVLDCANELDPDSKFDESDEKFLKSNEVEEVKEADETDVENTSVEPIIEDEPTEEAPKVISARFVRRPERIEDISAREDRVTVATATIHKTIELPAEEFEEYLSNLRQDKEFLKEFKPEVTESTYDVIAVTSSSSDSLTLLVDNSGSSSAQYVAVI